MVAQQQYYITIAISVFSGILTWILITWLAFTGKKLLESIRIQIYNRSGIRIDLNNWHEEFYDEEKKQKVQCEMSIKQKVNLITGDFIRTVLKNDEEFPTIEKRKIQGRIDGKIVYAILYDSSHQIKYGTFLLEVVGDADILKGRDCWFDSDTSAIRTSEVIWCTDKNKISNSSS